MKSNFAPGQRWISNTEANLGLGIVVETANRRVVISFPAAGEERAYAVDNAPLSRIIYQINDQVTNLDGVQFTVVEKAEHNGLVIYQVEDVEGEMAVLPEIDLDCFVHFNSPKDRLISGLIDPQKFFKLRSDALGHLRDYQLSGVSGLLGPRVQLLPHQLYIANQVGRRHAPRVLLADEVGLGKTIEAGLITHMQLQTGMASRVLILVPDSLLHQWLVEMLRRFNLQFSVLDEAHCEALGADGQNPFEAQQLVLCPLSFVVNSELRFQQAMQCDWDLLLVDEAHHLKWSPELVSPEYACVEALAGSADGVLLLTATPEQLGVESHFARLRLLDPDRYYDLQAFLQEEDKYQAVNDLAQQLISHPEEQDLPQELIEFLGEEEVAELEAEAGVLSAKKALSAVLDRHGTGRVLFRNTRQAVTGFPSRTLISHELQLPEAFDMQSALAQQVMSSDPDAGSAQISQIEACLQIEKLFAENWLDIDQRVGWLLDYLKQNKSKKVLLICSSAETAITLEEHLRTRCNIRSAVFHEGMSLINRDRAAAYFADTEESAQLLVCSEIGSEGRNFQFAHQMVMFDLPLNPDLLEQRIGRLDRIGQLHDIEIHVPYYKDTAQHVLLDWYHQGLNAFEQTCAIGQVCFELFENQLLTALQACSNDQVVANIGDELVQQTAQKARQLREDLQQGRDQLLEMNSCRPQEAEQLIDQLLASEKRSDLADFIERACDQFGVELEAHSANTIIMRPTDHMTHGNFTGLKDEGVTATWSRDTALSREDMQYLSWEHPIVQSALDMVLSGEHGNTAVGTLKLKPLKPGTLLMECLFTLHCVAPAWLQLQRFLPATKIRVLTNQEGKDLSRVLTDDKLDSMIQSVPIRTAQEFVKQAKEPIEQLIKNAEKHAEVKTPKLVEEARNTMLELQSGEIQRLEALAKVNPNIKPAEIEYLHQQTEQLLECILNTSLRLDAVRLVIAV